MSKFVHQKYKLKARHRKREDSNPGERVDVGAVINEHLSHRGTAVVTGDVQRRETSLTEQLGV